MSTVKLAEHLILLEEHSHGLLNRAYNMIDFHPKLGDTSPDLEKFMKKLGAEFPKAADKLRFAPSEKGADNFSARATEIVSEIKAFYFTFSDAHNFNEQCSQLFRNIQPSLFNIDIETNPQMFRIFFSLFTNWAKLNILLSRSCHSNYDLVRQYVQSYARAHFITTGNTEKGFINAAGYCIDWFSTKASVYARLRQLLDPHQDGSIPNISTYIGIAIQSTTKILKMFEKPQTLLQRSLLSVIDKTDDMLQHKNQDVHMSLLLLPELREWVVYSYLLCPAELTQEANISTLVLALQDFVVLPLFRNQYINIHEEIDTLFSDYTIKTLKFKLSRQKNLVRDITENYSNLISQHTFYRRYLSTELETLHKFVRVSNSGVTISPKITLVLALLHLSTSEIQWYYIHRQAVVHDQLRPYRSSSKFTVPFDPTISDLINNAFLIRDALLKHTSRLVDGCKPLSVPAVNSFVPQTEKIPSAFLQYYTQVVLSDAVNVKQQYNLLIGRSQIPESARTITSEVITALEGVHGSLDHHNLPTIGFKNLRLNIQRLSILLVTKTPQQQTFNQDVNPILTTLRDVWYHTTYLDNLDHLLFQHIAPFKNMIWYLPVIQQDLTTLTAGIRGVPVQAGATAPPPSKHAKFCVSMVRTLSDAIYNVHKVCPEEIKSIPLRAANAIDSFLTLLTQAVCDGLVILSKFHIAARRHVSPLYAINLLNCDQSTLRQRQPGMESDLFDNTNPIDTSGVPILAGVNNLPPTGINYTEPIRHRQSCTFSLCAALCRIQSIRVYTYDLSPREYMTTALQAQIRFLVRSQVVPRLAEGTGMNSEVDDVLNTAEPDVTIQTNADNFLAILQRARQAGVDQEGPTHQIRRPSLLLLSLLNVLYLFHDLDRECNIGVGEIVRLILTTEFTGIYPRCGGEHTARVAFDQSQSAPDQSAPALKTPILTFICNWYMNLFSRDLESMAITHNEMLDMYDGHSLGYDKHSKENRPSTFWAHLYTDPTELRVLVSLCGPRGVEFFNKYLIMIVQRFTKKIFDILTKNINLLNTVRGRYTEPLIWTNAAEQLSDKEELLLYTAVVGNALQFRSMLRTCLKQQVQEQVPLIADVLSQSVHVAQTFVSDYMFDSRVIGVKQFAEGAAMNDYIVCDDLQLKEALRRLKASAHDARAWSLLPELYGLALYAAPGYVQRAKYLTSSEAFKNNLHLVTYAIRDLIGVFSVLPEETKSITPNAPEAIRDELKRFLRVVAFCVVNLPSSQNQPSSPELMVLLEKFVDASQGFVSMSFLEDLIPYSSLRTHYIRFLEAQSSGGDKVSEE